MNHLMALGVTDSHGEDYALTPTPPPPAGVGGANLTRRLSERDELAWGRLVRESHGRLQAAAQRILGNQDEASDIVQSALTRAVAAIDGFRNGSQLTTWLYRITVNEALMRLRARARRPEAPLDSVLPQFDDAGRHAAPVKPWADPDEALEQRETCELVRRSIDRLADDYRTVLILRDIEELDTAEVATLLGVTPNAVRIRAHRARLALRELLEPYMSSMRTVRPK